MINPTTVLEEECLNIPLRTWICHSQDESMLSWPQKEALHHTNKFRSSFTHIIFKLNRKQLQLELRYNPQWDY